MRGCPHCGAGYEQGQERCMECGQELPRQHAPSWSSPPPRLWLALVALLMVAVTAGAVVALAATSDEQPSAAPPTTSVSTDAVSTLPSLTEPTQTSEPTTTVPTVTVEPPTDTVTTATVITETEPPPPPTNELIVWPSERSGFTVVLSSIATSAGRANAERTARRALDRGLEEVGVLDSSDYSSLRSGYYVVFNGVFETRQQAEGSLAAARSAGFSVAYVREIRP